ncbi:MAG: hypothetical protein GY700_09525, partial [Propionibacteriaceae bacterium]|nr:hypothetical protein [Propionibacteriaceae bacterium]
VVVGPGSLFTSVLTNVLVPGIRDAIAASNALKVYVGNIVTQPGQTDGFSAGDHLRALIQHLGKGVLDAAIFNTTLPDEEALERYRADGAEIVTADADSANHGVKIVGADLVEDMDEQRVLWEKQDLLRHHPDKLADAVCRVFAGLEPAQR